MAKVLSIKNPFAYFVMHGMKKIENRSWDTKYRGRLYIHVSGLPWHDVDHDDINDFITNDEWIRHAEDVVDGFDHENWEQYKDGFKPSKDASDLEIKYYLFHFKALEHWVRMQEAGKDSSPPYMEAGCIIGHVDLVDVVNATFDDKYIDHPFAAPDQYHWVFENPVLIDPIRFIKGKLRLWEYDI